MFTANLDKAYTEFSNYITNLQKSVRNFFSKGTYDPIQSRFCQQLCTICDLEKIIEVGRFPTRTSQDGRYKTFDM